MKIYLILGNKLILITDIMGAFGNATTGEFSCGATGIYYEKDGFYPINNFTHRWKN